MWHRCVRAGLLARRVWHSMPLLLTAFPCESTVTGSDDSLTVARQRGTFTRFPVRPYGQTRERQTEKEHCLLSSGSVECRGNDRRVSNPRRDIICHADLAITFFAGGTSELGTLSHYLIQTAPFSSLVPSGARLSPERFRSRPELLVSDCKPGSSGLAKEPS